MVRIVQYNLLSTELANPDFYVNTDRKFLKFETRWKTLRTKLNIEISMNSIFCFQEVSLDLLEVLIPFLGNAKYTVEYNNYGSKYSGYMGICIAYPPNYKLEAIKMIKIGDVIQDKLVLNKLPQKNDHGKILMFFMSIMLGLLSYIGLFYKTHFIPEDSWSKATKKQNTLLCVRLSKKNKVFCVGTYHMPCTYMDQSLMILHSTICLQQMNKFAGNYKYILAGDFNFKPNSLMYEIFTKGGRYDKLVEVSKIFDTSQCNIKIATPVKSAYSIINKDPLFTNYAHTINQEPFSGCIDYIFVSKGWNVLDVKKLPDELPPYTYPSMTEPSDHLMLAANLEMKKRIPK